MKAEPRDAGGRSVLERTELVLWECFGLAILFMLLWGAILLPTHDWLSRFHGSLFGLSRRDVLFANYLLLGWFKISAFLFFLFPAVALHITRKRGV